MSQHNSPHVVDALRPEGLGGGGGVYQLNVNSVNPTRIVGVDDAGMPIEETIPHAYHRRFVHPDGGINRIPMRTAAVFSREPEAERYEQITTRDLIRDGFMPIEACPYTFEYKHIKGSSLAKVPSGESDCGGKPDGCEHMLKVIAARLAIRSKKHDLIQAQAQNMKVEDVERMVGTMADGVGAALAKHVDQAAAKSKLRAGKGEE